MRTRPPTHRTGPRIARCHLQVLGKHGGEVFFEQHAGAGLVFLSALTHATGVSGKGIWKLTIFFGYILNIGVPKRRRDGT